MKVIIAGSRDCLEYQYVSDAMARCGFAVTEVVCGEASGVDAMGKLWALERGLSVKSMPADWKGRGRKAGPERNRRMAAYADALVLVWDGRSAGSANMRYEAKQRGLDVYELIYSHKVTG